MKLSLPPPSLPADGGTSQRNNAGTHGTPWTGLDLLRGAILTSVGANRNVHMCNWRLVPRSWCSLSLSQRGTHSRFVCVPVLSEKVRSA